MVWGYFRDMGLWSGAELRDLSLPLSLWQVWFQCLEANPLVCLACLLKKLKSTWDCSDLPYRVSQVSLSF